MSIEDYYKCPECGAQGYDKDCDMCDGFGEVEVTDEEGEWEPCPNCDGSGVLFEMVECSECGHEWEL